MKNNARLKSGERDFFSKISEAVFTNPFSDRRKRLDYEITGLSDSIMPDKQFEVMVTKISEKMNILKKEKRDNILIYSGKDKAIIKSTLLFEVFHRFIDDFDRLILEQIKAGNSSIKVKFARNIISMLISYGFNEQEAIKYMAFFYQLRRAFYFIKQSIVGESLCMKKLRMHLWNNVFTHNINNYDQILWSRMEDFSTLFLGETGTGKGTAASAIGKSGFIPFDEKRGFFIESFTKNFISINLSQYSESLIESELFGHKKGSFTGAIESHEGILSKCSEYGSIFLDEIGEISIPIQIKLLRVLQERTFFPVGSHSQSHFRGRVIAAANRTISELRGKDGLRDDFYYRLCSDIIIVPSLRERLNEDKNELRRLLRHILFNLTNEGSEELIYMVESQINKDIPNNYLWPGNVRELEQSVRRILLNGYYYEDIKSGKEDTKEGLVNLIESEKLDASGILSEYCKYLYNKYESYEKVSDILGVNWRTVKKYLKL